MKENQKILTFCFVFDADSSSSRLGSSDSNGNENPIIEVPEMTNTQKLMNIKQNSEVRLMCHFFIFWFIFPGFLKVYFI